MLTSRKPKMSPETPSDFPDMPRLSSWEEFVFDLKLMGVILAIIGIFFAIAHFSA
jgi:hypothetical protein